MHSKIRLFSLNIGLRSNLSDLMKIIADSKLDIIFLQEVRLTKIELSSKIETLGFKCEVNIDSDEPLKPGTAVLWKSTLDVYEVTTLVTCRAQILLMDNYALLNVYAPSGSSNRYERGIFFSTDVFNGMILHPDKSWVIGGDFNCLLQPIDVEKGIGFSQKKCPQLENLVTAKNLKDVYRAFFPYKSEFTFFRSSAAPSRLDRFYFPDYLLPNVSRVCHLASLSDHHGILVEVLLETDAIRQYIPKRRTFWKLNSRILADEDFLETFQNFGPIYNLVLDSIRILQIGGTV